jgi:hypothetical protein
MQPRKTRNMGALNGWSPWPEKDSVHMPSCVTRNLGGLLRSFREKMRVFHDLLKHWDLFVLHINTTQETTLFLLTTKPQIQHLQSSYSVSQYNVSSTDLCNVVIRDCSSSCMGRHLNDQPVGIEHAEQKKVSRFWVRSGD